MKKLLLFTLASLPLFAAAQVPSYVPTSGLVGWWPFNGNANDESGNGNNGTVNGSSLTTDRFGNQNKAYNFNGSSNYIDVGTLPTLGNNPSALTQNAWVLAAADQSNYCKMPLISKRHSGNNSWATLGAGGNGTIGVPWNNQAYFFVNGPNYSAGITNALYSNNVTNDGQWHMLTGTKNGSTYKLYFDGILQDSIIDNYSFGSNDNMIFGHESIWGFSCEQWYAGKLDDIGIWNRALTSQEISGLYNGCNNSVTQQPSNQSGFVGGNAIFTTACTDPNASFQWQTDLGLGFQNLSNAGQYSGTNTANLLVSNLSLTNSGQTFRCVITSGSCSDTTQIVLIDLCGSIQAQPSNQSIAIGNSAVFATNSSDPNATYQWQTDLGLGFQNLSNAGQYSGVTTNTLNVNSVNAGNNNQAFRCIVSSGSCTDTTSAAYITITTGITESTSSTFTIFPNPANTTITVSWSQPNIKTLTLTDAEGRAVRTYNVTGTQAQLSLEGLASGVYFLSGDGEEKAVQKIFKQ